MLEFPFLCFLKPVFFLFWSKRCVVWIYDGFVLVLCVVARLRFSAPLAFMSVYTVMLVRSFPLVSPSDVYVVEIGGPTMTVLIACSLESLAPTVRHAARTVPSMGAP